MILCKVDVPVGVDKRSYWESMILESLTTNSALCEQTLNKSCLSSFKVSAFACPIKLLNSLSPDIQHNLILHIDDKDIGWSPISNDNGRLFVNACR